MPKEDERREETDFFGDTLKKILKSPMSAYLSKLAFTDIAEAIVEQNDEMNITEAVALSIAAKAFNGDVSAATFMRDTVGEKPKDKSEVDNKISVGFSMTLVDGGTPEVLAESNPIETTLEESVGDDAKDTDGESDSERNQA